MSELRDELVQVAAVAVAWIENIDNGHTDALVAAETNDVLDDVVMERQRQEYKWGQRNMGPDHWLPILLEEMGEVGTAVLNTIDWTGVEATDE